MRRHRLAYNALAAVFLAIAALWVTWTAQSQIAVTVSGIVVNEDGEPVPGARVRLKTTSNLVLSGADGSFVLSGPMEGVLSTITAWQEGYLVGWSDVVPPASGVTIRLKRHYTTDDPNYEWVSSHDRGEPLNCAHCMVAYPEWREDAHAKAGKNPRFFSMYNGTDIAENPVSPGYKLDFPGTAGNCATCHAPAAAVSADRYFATADMNQLRGVEAEGIFCEFCHKVGDVYLNPMTGLPYDNAPGVLSMRLYRPSSGGAEQLFFGTFDDVTRRVAYSPLEKKSQFCAPCHHFSYWGTPIYESFSEWLNSSYAKRGIECQACHMRPTDRNRFVYPEVDGGFDREYARVSTHLMPGASDVTILQNTVALTVTAAITAGRLEVDVSLYNAFAGHHVPTDYPGRQMLLVLEVTDEEGQPLTLLSGDTLPEWAGNGATEEDHAGKPGRYYAKVLKDAISGEMPVVSYWKQTLIVEDTRLPAETRSDSRYIFQPPPSGAAHVRARVLFRRLFLDLMRAKGWDNPDIEMARVELNTDGALVTGSYLPDQSQVFDPPLTPTEPASQNLAPKAGIEVIRVSRQTTSPANFKRTASAIAITPDGETLLAVNPDSHSLSLIDTSTRKVLCELAVGWQPRAVAVDDSGRLAVVANWDSDDVTLIDIPSRSIIGRVYVGREPAGAVLSTDGTSAYITVAGEDAVVLVDTAAMTVTARLPTEPRPYGIALLSDDETLLVTHLLSGRTSVIKRKPWYPIYLPLILKPQSSGGNTSIPYSSAPLRRWQLSLESVIPAWPDSNLSQRIIISPDGKRAYLPQTRSNATNRALTFDTTVFPIVTVLDIAQREMIQRDTITLDTADRPVGIPADAAFSPDGSVLWVVNSASNDVSVIAVRSRKGLQHIKVQDNPQGIVLSPDGGTAYVNNMLAGTISVIDTKSYTIVAHIPVTNIPLPPALLQGKRLFFSSDDRDGEKLAREQWISCNTCHFDGDHDGRTWFFRWAGPRNTTSLRGMVATYPLRWSAEWDESADSEFAIRREQFGKGLIAGEMNPPLGDYNQGRSYDLDCLALFLDHLALRPSPYPFDAAARRGQEIFQRADTQCASCHPAPLYTDLQKHDVGTATADERIGASFDTPTLKGLWASAPYLHDGSARTLYDVLTTRNPSDRHGVTSHLTEQELQDLIAFMLALPNSK